MNDKLNKIDDFKADGQLKELFASDLPKANENPWFTSRVMNRLPERAVDGRTVVWQWVCYIMSAVALVVGVTFSGNFFIISGFNLTSLTMLLAISLMVTICGAILTIPSLIRILREP